MFSLDDVPVGLSQVWASTELEIPSASICKGASNCATSTEPSLWVRAVPAAPMLLDSLTPRALNTKCPNKYQQWRSSKLFLVWAWKQNKTACFGNFFWSYPPLSEQDWKNSSALPPLALLFLVAATTHSQTCPPHPHRAPVQVSRDAVDWEKAMAESQGLAKRLTVHPH